MYTTIMIAAVPTARKADYLDHAREAGRIMKEHGAIAIMECWGADVPGGEVTSFPMAVKCADDETVVASWVTWKSKAASDAGMGAFMQDERTAKIEMPFDGQRLIYGGFDVMDTA